MLRNTDTEAWKLLDREANFRRDTINLVPSDNHTSPSVQEAVDYPLFYSENDGRNYYYPGCETVHEVELLCRRRALAAFPGSEYVNVKPNDGTRGNEAAYRAVLKDGAKILSMDLSCGGHLSHGLKWNYSGQTYDITSYGLNEAGQLDYDEIRRLAHESKPDMIIAGGSSCAFQFDFERFATIAKEVDALLHSDISHFSGLVVAGEHPSPFPHSDLVMTTTQKTLRGPKGALLFCREGLAKKVDRAVFPGVMAHATGPQLLGKAICLGEATTDDFRALMRNVRANAKHLCGRFLDAGYDVVGGGTETHLFVLDLRNKNLEGREAQRRLQAIGILANKQLIPYDAKPPVIGSGLRMGSPCASSRGMGIGQMDELFDIAHQALDSEGDRPDLAKRVAELSSSFPVPLRNA